MKDFTYCILIPNYNHGDNFHSIIAALAEYNLPIIVVNDGSDEHTTKIISDISASTENVHSLHFVENKGKGRAVIEGMKYAANEGFSHVIQIDADGQHDLNDINVFLSASKNNPEALISGVPTYDESVPMSRFIGRYITHFWVWVETLSFSIKDSMCGFRLYPVTATIDLLNKTKLGQRMDFDTEIMVHLFWNNVRIIEIPTKVTYPQDGDSHFRLFRDNWLISKMHTRLVFGMLFRLPGWIIGMRKVRKKKHWGNLKEKGTMLGINILFWIYRLFGKRLFLLILHPVIAYYLLTSASARHSSRTYLQHLESYQGSNRPIKWHHIYSHFYEFGVSAIDKLGSWSGNITRDEVVIHNEEIFDEIDATGRGAVLLGSHLGNLELCRALGEKRGKLKINAIVFNKNAVKFQQLLRSSDEDSQLNLIHAENMGMGTAIILKQKVDDGEVVVIVGDRTSVKAKGRVQYVDFLGEKAPFSEGPFIMAGVLRCPVYLIFCLKERNTYNIYLEKFTDSSTLPRRNKNEFLYNLIQNYANRLAYYCMKAPRQWFNFFNFWHNDNAKDVERRKYQ